ncbi:porin [Shumkonia mesophila]|uniref:porin n=1 Tax=Shumkonia mesophila TaxID=2838854 RepID=UPI0029342B7B|nr:porin [Shumkonia mesophila]
MKRNLLCTTAMAAVAASFLVSGAALAAEKPTLEMSGYLRFQAWGSDQDVAPNGNNRGTAFEMDDVHVHFDGSAKADNGLEYGFHVELEEGGSDSKVGYDVANVYLAGGWGRLELGSAPGAEDVFKVGAVSIMADLHAGWDGDLMFDTVDNAAYIGSNMAGNTDDANKVTYYTPEFSGFGAAVSYTPDSTAFFNSDFKAETADPENVVEVALKYAATFSDIDVEVSARGITGRYGLNDTGDPTTELEDVRAWGAGVKVGYAGFELAGSYTDNGDTGIAKANTADGADAGGWWDVGLACGTGPYKVSVAYMRSWAAQPGGVQDDEVDFLSVGGLYAAAPGLDLYAAYQYVGLDRAGNASDNEANLFMVGTQVSF